MSDAAGGFAGLRVLSLESRRAAEMAKLITSHGGQAIVAPSMREVPLESNTEAFAFARKLAHGEFQTVIFLTGGGTRALIRVVETVYPREEFVAALHKVAVVVRGPKPGAVLRELGVPVTLSAPEPNTWREVLAVLDERGAAVPLEGQRVAIQEYGASNLELVAGLVERGAEVTSVPVYEWALPEDLGPLRAAIEAISRGEVDVVLFTTAMQATYLFQVAAAMKLEAAMRKAFSQILIASIGPVTSERLHECGLLQDLEPSHPKMGYLVSETAQQCAGLLGRKRAASPKVS